MSTAIAFAQQAGLLEFPSYEDALAFYRSDAYRDAREIRLRCAVASVVAMEGLPGCCRPSG